MRTPSLRATVIVACAVSVGLIGGGYAAQALVGESLIRTLASTAVHDGARAWLDGFIRSPKAVALFEQPVFKSSAWRQVVADDTAQAERSTAGLQDAGRLTVDSEIWLPGLHSHYLKAAADSVPAFPPGRDTARAAVLGHVYAACADHNEGKSDAEVRDGFADLYAGSALGDPEIDAIVDYAIATCAPAGK